MKLKIVTDSTADLPVELARELDVAVVPMYVRFGEKVYRDRIDISEDELYHRLVHDSEFPNTVQPSPQDFADVYRKVSGDAEGIISIHLSKKLSGTYNSALQGKETLKNQCPIEVIDSQLLTMGLGLLVIAANTLITSGQSMKQVTAEVKRMIPGIHFLALLDTLKYLAKGGRIGKVKALLGSVLNVKPMLGVKDGELVPVAQVRTRDKGIDRLFDSVKNAAAIEDMAVVYNTTPEDAQMLIERLGSIFPRERIRLARLGPALGVHGGPGILSVIFRERV